MVKSDKTVSQLQSVNGYIKLYPTVAVIPLNVVYRQLHPQNAIKPLSLSIHKNKSNYAVIPHVGSIVNWN